jgi:hypothetical protein
MKTIAEYLKEAAEFEHRAEEATDQKLKIALKGQAEQYRKLALARAEQLGIPPDEVV